MRIQRNRFFVAATTSIVSNVNTTRLVAVRKAELLSELMMVEHQHANLDYLD